MANRWTSNEWREASAVMQTRAGGRCELCGLPLMGKVVRHHRQRRAVGGDRLGNLLLLHDACHVRIHAHPEESRQAGWIVSSYELDPTAVPVAYQRARQVYLGDDGGLGAVAGP